MIANMFNTYDNMIWHASSQFEADDIQRNMSTNLNKLMIATQIIIASNIPYSYDLNDIEESTIYIDGPLRVVFLSRISE